MYLNVKTNTRTFKVINDVTNCQTREKRIIVMTNFSKRLVRGSKA